MVPMAVFFVIKAHISCNFRFDIKMTRELQEALGKIGITLHDHLVIGRDGHESFRARGLL